MSAASLNESQDIPAESAQVSEFIVPAMDCPSEERMIRLALDSIEPRVVLEFDIANRSLKVFHQGAHAEIRRRLESLHLGARLKETASATGADLSQAIAAADEKDEKEAVILRWLLGINAFTFVIEFCVGWLAESTGLIADSLDMLADAMVYGLALYAVGRSVKMKLRAAHISGWLQVALALGAMSEVLRRFIFGSDPVSTLMISFGAMALVVNIGCLLLISRNKESGAHMKASWIFSANDVIANLGVITAGILVAWTGSAYPDLVIGLIIGIIVLLGARRILQLES